MLAYDGQQHRQIRLGVFGRGLLPERGELSLRARFGGVLDVPRQSVDVGRSN
jgi:hypothetical protein